MTNICTFFSTKIKDLIPKSDFTEIRLRVGKPLCIKKRGQVLTPNNAYIPTASDINETMERISSHSFYAYETELAQGYITLPGGHRVGVAGQVVVENGIVRTWRYISAINIRIAHSVIGCADAVLPQIKHSGSIYHTMIIAPPGCGKTTLLRDIVRQISNEGITVGLADERSEVAGCYQGVPQNDVGLCTDVIDGCPKDVAMTMLLRSMSPDVIAVDELGGEKDAHAVQTILNAGVKILCTVHGNNTEDIKKNPTLAKLLQAGVFEKFVVLGSGCRVLGVFDH